MKYKYQSLYDSMQADIKEIESMYLPEKEMLENCFESCSATWYKMADWLKVTTFPSEAAEIDFFKNIKPKFTGVIEYYIQRYQAILFFPPDSPDDKLYHYEQELKRIDRFYETNSLIYSYVESGKTDRDWKFYMRTKDDCPNPRIKVYDLDPETSTCFDHVFAGFVAMELYREYVNRKMVDLRI